MAIDRTPVDQKRNAFAQARTTRLQAQADLATRSAAVAALPRTGGASDPQLTAAKAAAAAQQRVVVDARTAEKAALVGVTSALGSWLLADPARDVARLESQYPIVLLPVRVETRFVPESSELRVRVYPHEISPRPHPPQLSSPPQTSAQP